MKRIVFILLMNLSLLATTLTIAQAAQVVSMKNAINYSIAVKTDQDVYTTTQPINIFAEITNNNNNETIDFTKVYSYFQVQPISSTSALNDQQYIEVYQDLQGHHPFDTRGVQPTFTVYPHSTRLGLIGQYSQTGVQVKLSPGKYVVRVRFADNTYDAHPYSDSQKIITVVN